MPIPNFSTLLNDVLNGKYEALVKWGAYYRTNSFNEEEIKEAIQKSEKLFFDDSPQKSHALHLRAYMHEKGLGGPQNYNEAIRLYEQAIKLGNAYAMYNRANMHQQGLGGEQNYPKAIHLYEQAIKLGNAYAMNNRAYMHNQGLGGEQNYTEASRLYEQAIKLGNASAMYARGYMHQNGLGGKQNYPEAIRLYEKAIKLGNAYAMCARGYMHQQGLGGKQNYPEAIRLYEKAIELGNDSAMYARGYMHQKRLGGEQNYPKAIHLYEQAIELGNASAMYARGYMHEIGLGGSQNDHEAIRLFEQAIKLGHPFARTSLVSLQKQQQLREQLKPALDPYKNKFNDLLAQLKGIRDLLAQKAKNNSKYETVASGVSKLCTTLQVEMSAFFENPTALQFQECHQQCALTITATEEESANHRGWHAVDPIIRGIIGVLAAIAVVPALIVEVTSTHGYMQTFFAKPATATSEKIAAITTQFNEQKEAFEKQDNEVSKEIRNFKK